MTRGQNTSIVEPFEDPESKFRQRKNQKIRKEIQSSIQPIMTSETYNPQSSVIKAAGENVDPTGYTYGQDKPKTQTQTDYDVSTMPKFGDMNKPPSNKTKSTNDDFASKPTDFSKKPKKFKTVTVEISIVKKNKTKKITHPMMKNLHRIPKNKFL